uniref:Uncharacterized protein n=1 Tax=Oryzias sinensis TaxID=183150 RepID=A0A8C7ZVK2_9TELE
TNGKMRPDADPEGQRGQRMIFTGPDGIGDYRPKLTDFPHHIGVGPVSHEATGDLGYLWRAAPHAPPTTARHSYVGEVGWGWQYNQQLNQSTLLSSMQIKVGGKRSMCRFSPDAGIVKHYSTHFSFSETFKASTTPFLTFSQIYCCSLAILPDRP